MATREGPYTAWVYEGGQPQPPSSSSSTKHTRRRESYLAESRRNCGVSPAGIAAARQPCDWTCFAEVQAVVGPLPPKQNAMRSCSRHAWRVIARHPEGGPTSAGRQPREALPSRAHVARSAAPSRVPYGIARGARSLSVHASGSRRLRPAECEVIRYSCHVRVASRAASPISFA